MTKMKINRTTIKNGIAYGWTMPDKMNLSFWFPRLNTLNYKKYNEAVDKARAEAIEWEDQDEIMTLLRENARKLVEDGSTWGITLGLVDGDYSHEPIDVEMKSLNYYRIKTEKWK